jgi:Peptidase family S58
VGSIIVVVATDAPLIPTQLKRVAKRVTLGLGRDGSYSGDGSGDIFIALSTANPRAASSTAVHSVNMLPNEQINPIFLATVQATEEAVINALVAAEPMSGVKGHTVNALPHERLREILRHSTGSNTDPVIPTWAANHAVRLTKVRRRADMENPRHGQNSGAHESWAIRKLNHKGGGREGSRLRGDEER